MRPDEMPPTPMDELLERVVKRGRYLRRKRLLVPLIVTAGLIGGLVPVAMSLSRTEGPLLVSGDPTTPPASNVSGHPSSSPTPRTLAADPDEPSPEPTTRCRDSFDEACGPFVWDPEPRVNRPVSITITFEPAEPVVGQEVTFTVTVRDRDAPHVGISFWDTGGGRPGGYREEADRLCREGHGAWTPPEPRAGEGTFTYSSTYDRSGIHRFRVGANSATRVNPSGEIGESLCQSPYASDGVEEVSVTVSGPGPTGVPTT